MCGDAPKTAVIRSFSLSCSSILSLATYQNYHLCVPTSLWLSAASALGKQNLVISLCKSLSLHISGCRFTLQILFSANSKKSLWSSVWYSVCLSCKNECWLPSSLHSGVEIQSFLSWWFWIAFHRKEFCIFKELLCWVCDIFCYFSLSLFVAKCYQWYVISMRFHGGSIL